MYRYVFYIPDAIKVPLFTALQCAGSLSHGKRVCMSVRPSVCHSVNCDKTNESSAEILIPHER